MTVEKETKKLVKVEVYTGSDEEDKVYEGRLLGLIDDKEFNSLIKSPQLQAKCITKGTISLSDITTQYQELEGLRVVIAAKKIGEEIATKILFISERLDRVSYVKKKTNEAAFTGESDSFIMIKEEEVKHE